MKVCIIVPMYNEAAIARESIETILSYTQKLPLEATLLIVDDGSCDDTSAIITSLSASVNDARRLQVITHEKNFGYGAALRTGMRFAIEHEFDYLLFMDSDLTNHPKYLEPFCVKILEGYDYIKATRYALGGGMVGVPWKRQCISRWGNRIARILFGVPLTDITNGFRALKVSLAAKLKLTEAGFPIMMEELCQVQRLTTSFAEVPSILTSRGLGQGNTHFSYSWVTLWRYLSYGLKSFLHRFYGHTS